MSSYPPDLYAQTRDLVRSSAATIVPDLIKFFAPKTVLDVGCGEGQWLTEFDRHGCNVTGIDGPHVQPPVGTYITQDLENPLPHGRYDLALTLEVAEHLSPARATSFVADLCAAAPTIVFSAAIPGQGGAGHLNEQWPTYWAALFAAHGYPATGGLRTRYWTNQAIQPWYRQNLLVFGDLGPLSPDGCPDLVHPEIWAWYR